MKGCKSDLMKSFPRNPGSNSVFVHDTPVAVAEASTLTLPFAPFSVELETFVEADRMSRNIGQYSDGTSTVHPFLFISLIPPCAALPRHVYSARPKDDKEDDKQTRGVLSFAASSAPYKCCGMHWQVMQLERRPGFEL